MLIGTILNSSVRGSYEIQNDTQSLLFSFAFKGHDIPAGTVTNAVRDQLIADFQNAFNGKVTLTYIGASNTPMIANQFAWSMAEIFAATGGGIFIEPVAEGAAHNYNYVASFRYDLSNNGCLKLNQNNRVKIEFESMSKYDIGDGNGAVNDATLTIETYASPVVSNNVVVIEALPVQASQTLNFDCTAHTNIVVPTTLDRLQLRSAQGILTELRGDGIPMYLSQYAKATYEAYGLDKLYNQWVTVGCAQYTSGTIALASGSLAYLMSNRQI